jgi:hypothetical protein
MLICYIHSSYLLLSHAVNLSAKLAPFISSMFPKHQTKYSLEAFLIFTVSINLTDKVKRLFCYARLQLSNLAAKKLPLFPSDFLRAFNLPSSQPL